VANIAYGSNSVSVLLGNGNGTFGVQTQQATGNNPRAVTTGDFNGDGKVDLVTPNTESNTVSVLLGNGNGSFGVHTQYSTGNGPQFVVAGDLNGDGSPDLGVANSYSNTISVLLNLVPGIVGADEPKVSPAAFLRAPAPNPFVAQTVINFTIQRSGEVKLAVFDVSGRMIRSLVSGDRPAGAGSVMWDGTDESGRRFGPGVYFVRLVVPGARIDRKAVLLQ
jgi:hypothetical protein